VGYFVEGLGQQLLFRVADQLAHGRVHLQVAPVRAQQGHPDRGVLEGTPEALLALLQRLHGAFALLDVTGVDDVLAYPRVAEEVGAHALQPAPGPVLVPEAVLHQRTPVGLFQALGEGHLHPLEVLGV
jgi:hypothetical protein